MNDHPKKQLSSNAFLKAVTLLIICLVVASCAPVAQTAATEPAAPTAAVQAQPTAVVQAQPTEVTQAQPTEAATAVVPVETAVKKGGTLTWAELGDFNSWNAWTMSSTNDIITNMVYSRLLWKDDQGKIHPDLATDWTVADDGLSMTLNIRKGVKWHDGKDLTAKDLSRCTNTPKIRI